MHDLSKSDFSFGLLMISAPLSSDGIFTQSYCLFMEPSLLFSDVPTNPSKPAPCSAGVLPL